MTQSVDAKDPELADAFLIDGVELPNIRENRSVWARHAFMENPELSQVCPKGLVWMQYTDGIWYSMAGNWSRRSPSEKIVREALAEAEYEANVETALQYYERVIYQGLIRQAVLERDGYTCQLCGKVATSKLHVHHVLKRNQGGTDHMDNLLTVCSRCHKGADTKLYDPEWINPRGGVGLPLPGSEPPTMEAPKDEPRIELSVRWRGKSFDFGVCALNAGLDGVTAREAAREALRRDPTPLELKMIEWHLGQCDNLKPVGDDPRSYVVIKL